MKTGYGRYIRIRIFGRTSVVDSISRPHGSLQSSSWHLGSRITRSTAPNMREGSHGSPRKRHALISTCASPERGPRSARYFDVPLRSGPATPPQDQCAQSEGSTRSTTPNMREGSHGSPRKRHALISTGVSPERRRAPHNTCLLYTSPSPRDRTRSRMPSSA